MFLQGAYDIVVGILVAQALFFGSRRLLIYGLFPVRVKFAVFLIAAPLLYLSIRSEEIGAQLCHVAAAVIAWGYLRRQPVWSVN